jgi:hypothetical protein
MSSHDGQNRPVSRELTWSVGSGPDTCGNSAIFFLFRFLFIKIYDKLRSGLFMMSSTSLRYDSRASHINMRHNRGQ